MVKFRSKVFKTSPLSHIVTLESVTDKLGNIFYCITCSNGVKQNEHYFFRHLSSALDFIDSNFGD